MNSPETFIGQTKQQAKEVYFWFISLLSLRPRHFLLQHFAYVEARHPIILSLFELGYGLNNSRTNSYLILTERRGRETKNIDKRFHQGHSIERNTELKA